MWSLVESEEGHRRANEYRAQRLATAAGAGRRRLVGTLPCTYQSLGVLSSLFRCVSGAINQHYPALTLKPGRRRWGMRVCSRAYQACYSKTIFFTVVRRQKKNDQMST